jgi:heterodisulfide reductase subunit C
MSEEMPEGLRELVKEKVLFCYQCGSCVGSCPTARAIPEYNPRKMMEKLILGDWEEVLSDKLIWLCTLCHTCYEVCPQGVGISHIIIELRNLAAERGMAPAGFLEGAKQMAATGWTTPLTGAIQRARVELGLPEIKATDTGGIKKLMKRTGFTALETEKG